MFSGLRTGKAAFTDAVGAAPRPDAMPTTPLDGNMCPVEVSKMVLGMRAMPNCADLGLMPVRYAAVKRISDILGSLLMLVLLAPLMLFLAALVKFTSAGPVLYVSRRVGLGGVLFPFFKFRTMELDAETQLVTLLQNNEKDGPIFKMVRDPRVTPVGRFLRRTSLDELPQLFNVVRGEMSLVGPRPPVPREVLLYSAEHLRRLSVTPGITCYWQVMGRSNLSFDRWMELDDLYIRDMSPMTDLKILLKTPVAVLRGDGAF